MNSRIVPAVLVVLLVSAVATAGPARPQAVAFTQVKLTDAFWAPRIETNRTVSIPHNFKYCRETGRFDNFAKAGGVKKGPFVGIYFNDSDVYKVIEGTAYSLQVHPDPKLEKELDELISWIAAAQQPNGYLNTYYTLKEPGRRWTNCGVRHELYCAGHLFEAAVAHYRATGKKTLLNVATRYADRIGEIFAPDKRHDVPGHEEIELALMKLADVTGQAKYRDLAKFFLSIRGRKTAKRPTLYGQYCQDHMPVTEQSEPTGHAVRAMYLYSGMTDLAAATGDKACTAALGRLWANTVTKKMYITGAIGSTRHGEAFGANYQLPNATAYGETCASIGMCLWNYRMALLHADAAYMDIFERTLYNGLLAGIDLSGAKFFYVNPLASRGNHHRQPFFGCACCPTNVVRFLPSLPGYVYATDANGIYVNLYAGGEGKLSAGETAVTLTQQTKYPWDGRVRLTVQPAKAAEFALRLRIPSWARGTTATGDLYRLAPLPAGKIAEPWKVTVNGEDATPAKLTRGYAVLRRTWKPGDVVQLDLPMPVRRVYANPQVKDDGGRVALQRGPVVYCIEDADNPDSVNAMYLPADAELKTEVRKDQLGGIVALTGQAKVRRGEGKDTPATLTAIPYYAWDHRKPGPMAVWIAEDRALAKAPPVPTLASKAKTTVSHCWQNDTPRALNDQIEPKNSADHSIPRLTWWDHKGTAEWVQYTFAKPANVAGIEVYWFSDEPLHRDCHRPKSWRVVYLDGETWKPATGASEYTTKADRFNKVTFDAVITPALRLEVQLQDKWSGGILEWRVLPGK